MPEEVPTVEATAVLVLAPLDPETVPLEPQLPSTEKGNSGFGGFGGFGVGVTEKGNSGFGGFGGGGPSSSLTSGTAFGSKPDNGWGGGFNEFGLDKPAFQGLGSGFAKTSWGGESWGKEKPAFQGLGSGFEKTSWGKEKPAFQGFGSAFAKSSWGGDVLTKTQQTVSHDSDVEKFFIQGKSSFIASDKKHMDVETFCVKDTWEGESMVIPSQTYCTTARGLMRIKSNFEKELLPIVPEERRFSHHCDRLVDASKKCLFNLHRSDKRSVITSTPWPTLLLDGPVSTEVRRNIMSCDLSYLEDRPFGLDEEEFKDKFKNPSSEIITIESRVLEISTKTNEGAFQYMKSSISGNFIAVVSHNEEILTIEVIDTANERESLFWSRQTGRKEYEKLTWIGDTGLVLSLSSRNVFLRIGDNVISEIEPPVEIRGSICLRNGVTSDIWTLTSWEAPGPVLQATINSDMEIADISEVRIRCHREAAAFIMEGKTASIVMFGDSIMAAILVAHDDCSLLVFVDLDSQQLIAETDENLIYRDEEGDTPLRVELTSISNTLALLSSNLRFEARLIRVVEGDIKVGDEEVYIPILSDEYSIEENQGARGVAAIVPMDWEYPWIRPDRESRVVTIPLIVFATADCSVSIMAVDDGTKDNCKAPISVETGSSAEIKAPISVETGSSAESDDMEAILRESAAVEIMGPRVVQVLDQAIQKATTVTNEMPDEMERLKARLDQVGERLRQCLSSKQVTRDVTICAQKASIATLREYLDDIHKGKNNLVEILRRLVSNEDVPMRRPSVHACQDTRDGTKVYQSMQLRRRMLRQKYRECLRLQDAWFDTAWSLSTADDALISYSLEDTVSLIRGTWRAFCGQTYEPRDW